MSRPPDIRSTEHEKTTPAITFTLKDEDGTAIPAASMTSIKVTITEASGNTIVNSRDEQDVFGTTATPVNGGQLHATTGAFEFQTAIGDTTLVLSPVQSLEIHDCLIVWTYNAGALRGDLLWRIAIPNSVRVA